MISNKDILAKLLATEDLNVIHRVQETASFNPENRTLVLPVWKDDIAPHIYDLFVGHEVGHALWTPARKVMNIILLDKVKSIYREKKGFHGFLNIIEDIRIERLIQRRYPGLRRPFTRAYRELFEKGWFADGKSVAEMNEMLLIDRLNIRFKAGVSVGIQFSVDEQHWFDKIEKMESFEDAIDLAVAIYEDTKFPKAPESDNHAEGIMVNGEELEVVVIDGEEDEELDSGAEGEESEGEESEGPKMTADPDSESDDESEDNPEADGESNGGESEDDPESESGEEPEDSTEGQVSTGDGSDGEGEVDENYDPEPETESAFDKAMKENALETGADSVRNVYLSDSKVDDRIVSWKEILKDAKYSPWGHFTGYYEPMDAAKYLELSESEYKKFRSENKSSIAYLAKEFEMRKSAAAWVRAKQSRTGTIDTVKMNSYKFNDDIFRRKITVPKGKSHGMILYIDWSGSMTDNILPTIYQTLNLVYFCRQVGIPFRVYAFTTARFRPRHEVKLVEDDYSAETVYSEWFNLLEFFNDRMNNADLATMTKFVLMLGLAHQHLRYLGEDYAKIKPFKVSDVKYRMSSTPLDDSIVAGLKIHDEFKKSHRLDIVNTIWLTDGVSDRLETNEKSYSGLYARYRQEIRLIHKKSKKSWKLGRDNIRSTDLLLKAYGEITGSNTVGFSLISGNNTLWQTVSAYRQWSEMTKIRFDMRKEGFIAIDESGYDKYFIMKGGAAFMPESTEFEVPEGASKAKLKSAFKKANQSKLKSRKMLNAFIDMVA